MKTVHLEQSEYCREYLTHETLIKVSISIYKINIKVDALMAY